MFHIEYNARKKVFEIQTPEYALPQTASEILEGVCFHLGDEGKNRHVLDLKINNFAVSKVIVKNPTLFTKCTVTFWNTKKDEPYTFEYEGATYEGKIVCTKKQINAIYGIIVEELSKRGIAVEVK
jgi:hypothetical protein